MHAHNHTQIVTASSLMGRPDMMKVDLLYQTFNDAFKYDIPYIYINYTDEYLF